MLKQKIQSDLKTAMFSKEKEKISTLRLLLSTIQYFEKSKGIDYEASDDDVLTAISQEVKKRREAIDLYRKGGRNESALKEESELNILSYYLPEQLSKDKIEELVVEAIKQTSPSGIQDMGKVMGTLMSKVKGKADGNLVSKIVREKLS